MTQPVYTPSDYRRDLLRRRARRELVADVLSWLAVGALLALLSALLGM